MSGMARAQLYPELSWLGFSVDDLLAEVRETTFPRLKARPRWRFARTGPLACVEDDSDGADIWLHTLLNHPETPERVLRFILIHELLHLEVPSREVEGKWCSHPPEFWARERELCPDRRLMWLWIYMNFDDCLHRDKDAQGILVRPRKARRHLAEGRVPLELLETNWDEMVPVRILARAQGLL